MLILGFGGLGELAAGMVCTLPSGEAVCSGSSGGGIGISILTYLMLICGNSGTSV